MKLTSSFQSFLHVCCVSLALIAQPRLVSAADQVLGGVNSEGQIKATITDTGAIKIARHNGSVYQDFWFSSSSSVGSVLKYNDGSARSFKSGYFNAGALFTTGSNTTSGPSVSTAYSAVQGSDNVGISQTTSYVPGQTFIDVTWVFTNNYATTINDLRWFFGGDTTLLGDDNGTGFFSTSSGNGRVGVLKSGSSGEFSIEGITAHHGYEAISYGQVYSHVVAGALTNQVSATVVDVGMAMEWRLASLAPGGSWTVQARFNTTLSSNTPTPTPTSTPVSTSTPTPEPTATPSPPGGDVSPTEIIFNLVVNGLPVVDALVYISEAGTCLTGADGKCTIKDLEAGKSYQAYIQKTGVQFTVSSLALLAGQEVQVAGTEIDFKADDCDANTIATRIHRAASAVASLRKLAAADAAELVAKNTDKAAVAEVLAIQDRITEHLDNYLNASREIPEVVLSCKESAGCQKTRISGAVRKTLRPLRHLQHEAFLANRVLRTDHGRSEDLSQKRHERIRNTSNQVLSILSRLPKNTWVCP